MAEYKNIVLLKGLENMEARVSLRILKCPACRAKRAVPQLVNVLNRNSVIKLSL